MKKILTLIFILLVLGLCLKSCLRRDIPSDEVITVPSKELQEINYPQKNKNVTILGVDYLQSQAPVGKFGGELVLTTIGEGPKTFNPCNSKDATSSSMAGLLYDGLLSTEPRTGEVVPLLAKSFLIKGNDYIITLRHGVQWSDGKEITADDVLYTYEEIVFAGFGNTATRDAMMIGGELPKLEKLDNYTIKNMIRNLWE